MKERITELSKGGMEKIWMGTFHSIFSRLLRIEAEYIGFTRNYSMYDSDESVNQVKQLMLSNSMPIDKPTPKSIHSFISNLKNKLILRSNAEIYWLKKALYQIFWRIVSLTSE